MSSAHFITVERRVGGVSSYLVRHLVDPKFTLEVEPVRDAEGRVSSGLIKRLCLPNSWTGSYHRQGALLGEALRFFADTLAELEETRAARFPQD